MILFGVTGGLTSSLQGGDAAAARSFLNELGHPNAMTRSLLVGEAVTQDRGYALLETLSDRFGGRMIGTPGHAGSLDYLEARLQKLGLETERQEFDFPGWVRGEDAVTLLSEDFGERQLRAAALGYVEPTAGPVEGELYYMASGKLEDLDPEAIRGKVLLTHPGLRFRSEQLKGFTDEHDLRGVLSINRVGGGQLLARTSSWQGVSSPVPAFSITQEEGFWLQRLVESGETVRVRLEVTSSTRPMKGFNLIARLPGRSEQKVVLGAHFDAWDLGQGALDNGLGVVQVFEVARLLRKFSPENEHTVEFVWFDAEEFGLWGSRHYAQAEEASSIRVMVNLDMVGDPQGVNAMGFDALKPVLETHASHLGAWSFSRPMGNQTWLGSDHHPFIKRGIPAITYFAPIDPDAVRFYHDFGDTMDKVDRAMLAKAKGVISLLVYELANDREPQFPQMSLEETVEMFREAGLEQRMRDAGDWDFD